MMSSTIFKIGLLAAITSAASLDGYTYQRTSDVRERYGDSSRGFGPEGLGDQFSSTQGSLLSGASSHLTDSSGSLFDRTHGQSSLNSFEGGQPSSGGTGFPSDASTTNSDASFGAAGTVRNIKPSPLNRYGNSLSRRSEGGSSSRHGHHFDRQVSEGGNVFGGQLGGQQSSFGGQLGGQQSSFGGQGIGSSINRQSPAYGKGYHSEQPGRHLSSSGRLPSTSSNFFSRQNSVNGNTRQPFGQVSTFNENFDELTSAADSFGGQNRGSSGSFIENPREYGNQFESFSDGQGTSFDSTGYGRSCDEQPVGQESFTNEQPGYASSFGGEFSDRGNSFTNQSPQLGHSRRQITQHGSSLGFQPTGALSSTSSHSFENTRTYNKPPTRFGSNFSGSSTVHGNPIGRQSIRSGNPLGGTSTRHESFHEGSSTGRGSFSS